MNPKIAFKKAEEIAYRQLAERCKVDLFFLCKYVLGYDIINEFVHGPVCASVRPIILWRNKELGATEFPSDFGRTDDQGMPTEEEKAAFFESLEEFIPGAKDDEALDRIKPDLNQLLALLPRGTLKTSVITIGGTLQYFLNAENKEDRILLDSETATNTAGFLGEIKGHMEGNETYRKMFYAMHGVYPDANAKDKNTRWHGSAIDLACRTKARKEPSIDTGGVDTTKNSRHYEIIIFDDLHSEINTKTKEQIEKVKEHWKLAYSLLDPGQPAIVIGTRWSHSDLYSMIIDEHHEDFNFITRQAKSAENKLLYPAKLDEEFLTKQRKKQGSYIFSCQYMNNPVDSETAKFRREWVQYKKWEEVEGIPINWYLTIDPGGDGEKSDFAGFVLSGMDYQSQLYVRYVLRAKLTQGQIVMKTFDLFRQFQPKRVVVETLASAGKSIEYTYKEKQKELGFWLPIQYIKGRNKAKSERIEALAPKYEFGQVFHILGIPQLKDFEDELFHYPKAKNDDAIDAFATVLEVATPPMRNRVQSDQRKNRKALFKKLNAPRSPMIGY